MLVAGLCRAYALRGLSVRPFKPQNMSNNAAVTPDGGEIGRAQALQARACGVPPSVDMNPVLLKPQSDRTSQVVVQGKVRGSLNARNYWKAKPDLMPAVLESFERLGQGADLILVEGAGSAAEVNLRTGDIANMGFAEAADLLVALIGDIERGGVIASLVGTVELLPKHEKDRLKGFIINKFRGDPTLFEDGLSIISERCGFPALGVVPYFEQAARLPAEDSVALERPRETAFDRRSLKIAVPVLARIANFDDFDPLLAEPDVSLQFVRAGQALPGDADLVIIPGTKATLADLAYLREQGWDIDLAAHKRRGGWVLGICGGYQMLGKRVSDPEGIEGWVGSADGLALLDVETVLGGDKHLEGCEGRDLVSGEPLHGYEMHIGLTEGEARKRPMLELAGRREGACSDDGRVMGCYLHGLFSADGFRHAFLSRLGERTMSKFSYETEVDQVLDNLASHLEEHLDLDAILKIAAR